MTLIHKFTQNIHYIKVLENVVYVGSLLKLRAHKIPLLFQWGFHGDRASSSWAYPQACQPPLCHLSGCHGDRVFVYWDNHKTPVTKSCYRSKHCQLQTGYTVAIILLYTIQNMYLKCKYSRWLIFHRQVRIWIMIYKWASHFTDWYNIRVPWKMTIFTRLELWL